MGAKEAADTAAAVIALFIYIVFPLLLLGGSWLIQHLIVSSRRKYLTAQEAYFRERIPMTNLKQFPAGNCSAPVLVTGSAVIANNYFVSFASAFKHIFGGELKGYTELLVESRREAVARMIAQAEELQANAIVNVRFATSSITAGAAELYAYGTAVVAVPAEG